MKTSLVPSHLRAVTTVLAFTVPGLLPAVDPPESEAAHQRGTDLKGAPPATAAPATRPVQAPPSGATTIRLPASGTEAPATVSASAAGRQIQVSSMDSTSVSVEGDNAEVRVAGQTLIVEKTKLLLDGKPLGDMPQETQKVEVTVRDGMLSVVGDGKELARAKLTPPPPQ